SSSAAREKEPNRAVASNACSAPRLGMPLRMGTKMVEEDSVLQIRQDIVQFYQLRCASSAHILEPMNPAATHITPAARMGGHILVDQLVAHGVRHVFCVPGESYLAVLDGLHDHDIDVTVCRQEGG